MTKVSSPLAGIGTSVGSGVTTNYAFGQSDATVSATEANKQITWRTAGTFSNLYCRVNTNATTSGNTTIKYRVGGANGNQVLTIGFGSTGEFSDVTNTDSVSAGNQVNYQIVNTTGGAIFITVISEQFSPNSGGNNAISRYVCTGSIADTSVNTTYYNTLAGVLFLGTIEARAQFKIKTSGTLQNLYAYISANTLSIATITSRIGGNPGNLSISIASGSTGVFEDTVNTDSISSGNLVNYALNSTVTTTFTVVNIGSEFATTSAYTHYIGGASSAVVVTRSATRYSAIVGPNNQFGNDTTETPAQMKTGLSFTASNLEFFLGANNSSTDDSITFRVDGNDGNQTITIPHDTSGYFEDTTHTDSIGTTNEINYKSIVGSNPVGNTPFLCSIGFLASYPTVTAVFTNFFAVF